MVWRFAWAVFSLCFGSFRNSLTAGNGSFELMKSNKILIGGLLGGLTSFLLGWILYGVIFRDTMTSPIAGLMKSDADMVWWALILSSLFQGLLISYIFGRWANITTAMGGASAGAGMTETARAASGCWAAGRLGFWRAKALSPRARPAIASSIASRSAASCPTTAALPPAAKHTGNQLDQLQRSSLNR